MRAYVHVANHHSGLLDEQVEELDRMAHIVFEALDRTSEAMSRKTKPNADAIADMTTKLRALVEHFDHNQIRRIQDNSSKTRLSILSYSLAWDCLKIAEQTGNLLTVFEAPFQPISKPGKDDEVDATMPA
jgi:Na+/phosphate symporter